MSRCPHHHGRCAYHTADPDRCPWCHASWAVIATKVAEDGPHGHSCEQLAVWSGTKDERQIRVAVARWSRQHAKTGPVRLPEPRTAPGEGLGRSREAVTAPTEAHRASDAPVIVGA